MSGQAPQGVGHACQGLSLLNPEQPRHPWKCHWHLGMLPVWLWACSYWAYLETDHLRSHSKCEG